MKYKDIWYYIQGNIRYKLYYSKVYFLFRFHIFDQICARIMSMDMQCYTEGQCKMCGCKTTALQMSNKACDKPCYPAMMNKKQWTRMKASTTYEVDGFTYDGVKFVKK